MRIYPTSEPVQGEQGKPFGIGIPNMQAPLICQHSPVVTLLAGVAAPGFMSDMPLNRSPLYLHCSLYTWHLQLQET